MKKMMTKKWEKMISGAFAPVDKHFADNPCEVKRAREIFFKAIKEKVGYREFRMHIREWFLSNVPLNGRNGALRAKILKDAMNKVSGLKPFFDYD